MADCDVSIETELSSSVGDREKGLSILFRREIAKIRGFEAEGKHSVEARKTTIFSGVNMTKYLKPSRGSQKFKSKGLDFFFWLACGHLTEREGFGILIFILRFYLCAFVREIFRKCF